MSENATLDFSKERRETEAMVSSLEQLQRKMELLDKQNLGDVKSALAKLNSAGSRDLEELKSSVLGVVGDIEKRIKKLGTVTANFSIADAFGKEVNSIKQELANLVAMYRVKMVEINNAEKAALEASVAQRAAFAAQAAANDKANLTVAQKKLLAERAEAEAAAAAVELAARQEQTMRLIGLNNRLNDAKARANAEAAATEAQRAEEAASAIMIINAKVGAAKARAAEAEKVQAAEKAAVEAQRAEEAASAIMIINAKLAAAKARATEAEKVQAAEKAAIEAQKAEEAASAIMLINARINAAKDRAAAADRAQAEEQAVRLIGLNNRIAAAQEAALAKAAAAQRAFANTVRSSVEAAMAAADASYQKYNSSTGRAGAVVTPGVSTPTGDKDINPVKPGDTDRVLNFSRALRAMGDDMGMVHSASRGLASGFGLLWLTWGQLLPMFAGAIISNSFVQVAKTGMEVGATMATIAVLGGNTATEMSSLNAELIKLGNSGPAGPQAIADAMKTLSLAGLKANDILSVTRDVMNFSVAGTTDLKTAADTLVSVSTAFNMGAAGFSRVGDVISKAAAESKTSVESFSMAMKTASVINAQYGVSLEDTATALAAMSQLGIEGTAAGTALRNAYADLSGRSAQVAKVLKQQGIEMRTATGDFRPLIDVVADLDGKLRKLDGISQKNLIQALLGERGAKGIVEMLRMINTETEGFGNKLEELRSKIDNSYGYAAISAAKLAHTTKAEFDTMKSVLSTSFVQAFEAMQPALNMILDSLQNTFASPSFIESLKSLVTNVAVFGETLVENVKIIGYTAAALMVLKLAKVGVAAAASALNIEIGASAAAKTADTAATVLNTEAQLANTAARTGAAGVLAGLAKWIPIVGTGITLLTGAWMAWDFWQNKSKNTAKEADDLYNDKVSKSLEDQANKLESINNLRISGLSLQEAELRYDSELAARKITNETSDSLTKLYSDRDRAAKAYEQTADRINSKLNGRADKSLTTSEELALSNLSKRVRETTDAVTAAEDRKTEAINRQRAATERVIAQSKLKNELNKQEMELANKRTFGSGKFDPHPKTDNSFSIPSDNLLDQVQQRYTKELALIQSGESDKKAVLDAMHNAHIINEGEYQAQLLDLSRTSMDQTLALNQEYIAKETEILQARAAVLGDLMVKAVARGKQGEIDQVAAAMKNLSERYNTLMEGFNTTGNKAVSKYLKEIQVASFNAAGAIYKLNEAEREYWKKDTDESKKAKALYAIERQYHNINLSVFSLDEATKAYTEASTAATEKHAAHIGELEDKYKKAKEALDAFGSVNMEDILLLDPVAIKQYDQLYAVLANIIKKLNEAKGKSADSAATAGELAFQKMRDKQMGQLVSDTSEAIYTGLTEGGQAGSASLRKIIEAELKKPVIMFIKAIVEPILGDIMSSFLGPLLSALGLGSLGKSDKNADGTQKEGINWASNSGFAKGFEQGLTKLADKFKEWGWDDMSKVLGENKDWMTEWAGNFNQALGYLNSLDALSQGKWGQAVGSAIGTYFGGSIGSAIGSKIGAWVDNLFSGESRTGGQYAMASNGQVTNNRRGESYTYDSQRYNEMGNTSGNKVVNGEIYKTEADGFGKEGDKIIKDLMKGTVSGINEALKAMDSKLFVDQFWAGLETSGKGRGGIYSGGKLSNGAVFGESGKGDNYAGTLYERTSTTSPDSKTLMENFTLDMKQVTIEALQAAEDLPKSVKDVLDGVDAESLTSDAADALLKTISDIITSVQTLRVAAANLPIKPLMNLSFDAYAALAKIGGGIEQLMTDINDYYTNFYTADEQKAQTLSSVQAALAKVGLAMPKTREEFRALVDAQDLTTEAGRKNFAALMAVSKAFASVTKTAEETAAAVKQEAKDALDAALATLQRAVDAEKEKLNKQKEGIQAQIDLWNEALTYQQNVYNNLGTIIETLDGAIRELLGTTASTASMLVQDAQKVLDDAIRTGVLPTNEALTTAINTLKGVVNNESNYSSQFEKDKATLILANQLDGLKGDATAQQNYVQTQIDLAKSQIGLLQEQLGKIDKEIARLDALVKDAENTIKTLEGIDTSILSVADAVKGVEAAITNWINKTGEKVTTKPISATAAALGSFTVGGGGGPVFGPSGSTVSTSLSDALLPHQYGYDTGLKPGVSKDSAAAALAAAGFAGDAQSVMEMSDDDYASWVARGGLSGGRIPGYASGGVFSGGIRLVGEDGPELEVTGPSRIYNASQTTDMLRSLSNGGSGSSATAEDSDCSDLLMAIHDDISGMRDDLQTQAGASVRLALNMDKRFNRWDGEGLPPTRP